MADLIERDSVIQITAETGALETQRRVKELPAVSMLEREYDPDDPWISVNNRLPSSWTRVIVCIKNGVAGGRRVSFATYDGSMFTIGQMNLKISGVTHWMPIPELPKEECDDEQ